MSNARPPAASRRDRPAHSQVSTQSQKSSSARLVSSGGVPGSSSVPIVVVIQRHCLRSGGRSAPDEVGERTEYFLDGLLRRVPLDGELGAVRGPDRHRHPQAVDHVLRLKISHRHHAQPRDSMGSSMRGSGRPQDSSKVLDSSSAMVPERSAWAALSGVPITRPAERINP